MALKGRLLLRAPERSFNDVAVLTADDRRWEDKVTYEPLLPTLNSMLSGRTAVL